MKGHDNDTPGSRKKKKLVDTLIAKKKEDSKTRLADIRKFWKKKDNE